ncbi:hypothetical protein ACIHIX_39580 [Streptomyces sp. NPDC051913]|uniref:hypothetical protein n=1 Tax=Streptomyces sp. NPDC051913 TaxID=3365676 RepID=UPI0037D3C893
MAVPKFRISCCKCSRPIPLAQDIYALDREWQRRFPSMTGILACPRCALETAWSCEKPSGREYVDGHIPALGKPRMQDFDAWSHLRGKGAHNAMALMHPRSALLQAAEPYLRHVAQGKDVRSVIVVEVRAVLREWDAADAKPDRVSWLAAAA